MLAIPRVDRRHLRATGVLGLLFLIVFLGGAATHVVSRGETLGEIALSHGVSVRDLTDANNISDPDLILIGQELQIPGSSDEGPVVIPAQGESDGSDRSHTVVSGDVLARIAADYHVSIADLIAANSIDNPDLIRPGQRLVIPSAGTSVGGAPLYHVVQRGDTLASIAARYGITVALLAKANGMTAASVIGVGIQLRLTAAHEFSPEGVGTIDYVVKIGDRLGDVAFAHSTTVADLVRLNNLSNADLIRPGQILAVPARGWICPVPGARFANGWGYPRSGGRFHQGTDLFAGRGTPVYAPVSGVVTQVLGLVGGRQFTLVGDDGHTYYGTHMDSFGADGIVSAGALIGTVGDSGNARGSSPHLHFEIYPGGVEAVNPYPTLATTCR